MTTNCPNCGAPVDHAGDKCAYCGTPYSQEQKITMHIEGLPLMPPGELFKMLTINEHRRRHGLDDVQTSQPITRRR